MAQGTMALFNELAESVGDGRIDFDTHDFYIALVSYQVGVTAEIAEDDPVPTWGTGGTTDISAGEVAAGGGYTAGGQILASVTWGQAAGAGKLDAIDAVWTSVGVDDPANVKTAVIYDNDATNKDCVCFIDLTSNGTTAVSLLAGNITVAYGAAGILTQTVVN